jgi:hypothetical protein
MTIELRHTHTGHARTFQDRQHVADFLTTEPDTDVWEGWQNLGELPPPSFEVRALDPAPQQVKAQSKAPVPRKATAKKGGKR